MKKGIARIVGAEHVSDDAKTLEAYSKDCSVSTPRAPNFVVRPGNVEEVQAVVKFANERLIPVMPCSSRARFNGATIPSQGGIVLDLTRMDKVVTVDERNRRVKIEPGVTWQQLQSVLEKHELMGLIPFRPHSGKSVLTSHLEREPMLISRFEYGDPLLSMEVILPQGELFRTGSACTTGATADAATDEVQPEGPGIDWFRLFQGAQGTMGVVTWANIKVEYLPKVSKIFFIPCETIEDTIEPLYRIQRRMIGHECLLLNNVNLASILAEQWPGETNKLKAALPPWTLILVLAGGRRHPEQKIEYEEEALREIGAELSLPPIAESLVGFPGVERDLPRRLRRPWPEGSLYWKFISKGSCQDLCFHTTLNRVPQFIKAIHDVAYKHNYSPGEVGLYIQPLEGGRACHCECNLYYDSDDRVEVGTARKVYAEGAEALLNLGAFYTRPYGIVADLVYRRTTDYTIALRKLKKLLDPNHIMSPGKLCF